MDRRSLRRNTDIEEAPLQGELMLFNPATSQFLVLNRTMAYVWRHCEGELVWARMIEGLADEFSGVEPPAAEADLRRAIDELIALGLVFDARSATT